LIEIGCARDQLPSSRALHAPSNGRLL
jgi:hypothetical protein